jgi:hypothetical protein
MSEEELAHVSELILETIDLRHKNKKLREAIETHKKRMMEEYVAELPIDIDSELWKVIE